MSSTPADVTRVGLCRDKLLLSLTRWGSAVDTMEYLLGEKKQADDKAAHAVALCEGLHHLAQTVTTNARDDTDLSVKAANKQQHARAVGSFTCADFAASPVAAQRVFADKLGMINAVYVYAKPWLLALRASEADDPGFEADAQLLTTVYQAVRWVKQAPAAGDRRASPVYNLVTAIAGGVRSTISLQYQQWFVTLKLNYVATSNQQAQTLIAQGYAHGLGKINKHLGHLLPVYQLRHTFGALAANSPLHSSVHDITTGVIKTPMEAIAAVVDLAGKTWPGTMRQLQRLQVAGAFTALMQLPYEPNSHIQIDEIGIKNYWYNISQSTTSPLRPLGEYACALRSLAVASSGVERAFSIMTRLSRDSLRKATKTPTFSAVLWLMIQQRNQASALPEKMQMLLAQWRQVTLDRHQDDATHSTDEDDCLGEDFLFQNEAESPPSQANATVVNSDDSMSQMSIKSFLG